MGATKHLFACLVIVAGWALIAGQLTAQQDPRSIIEADDDASGVGVVIAPAIAGQSIVVMDSEGNILDRIEDVEPEIRYQYRLAPGDYQISLPDTPWPFDVEVKPGEVEILQIGSDLGLGSETAVVAERRPIEPAGNELFFSLDPKTPGTDDPGPMAPE